MPDIDPKKIAAIFDWDGVIIDSHDQHEESWQRLADEENKSLPPKFFKMTFGMRNENIIPNFFEDWIDVKDQTEVARLADRKEQIYREIINTKGIEPLSGVCDLLVALNKVEIACSIGSSTPLANIEAVMSMIGLTEQFDAITAAEDVHRGKPDPEVFLKAAAKVDIEPKNCIVFEDTYVGIKAGLTAGMKVIAVATTHSIQSLNEAHIVCENLSDVSVATVLDIFS